jgi:hypothetical protein
MRALDKLVKGEVVMGMEHAQTDRNIGSCDVCLRAKQTRASYPRSDSRAMKVLELLHRDVMSPFPCDGVYMGSVRPGSGMVNNVRWVATLMDDYSGYAEVFLLEGKDEVGKAVSDAITRWERQLGTKVKRLKSGQGREYL